MLVESLAYQYTRKPPKTIKPRDNVLIRLCTIKCSYIQPLDGEQNRKFAADIEGWSKIARHLFIWDYTTNYNDYLGPHPNLRVLVPNVRYFIKHGAIGLFEEGEGDDFCELKNWLLLRVMWEPNLDGEKLIGEFLSGYYGLMSPRSAVLGRVIAGRRSIWAASTNRQVDRPGDALPGPEVRPPQPGRSRRRRDRGGAAGRAGRRRRHGGVCSGQRPGKESGGRNRPARCKGVRDKAEDC